MTDDVCILTQTPPKESMQEQIMKRSLSSVIAESSQHPLESSSKPIMNTFTSGGKIQSIHFSKKDMKTRKIVIHPQTVAVTFKDDLSASEKEILCFREGDDSLINPTGWQKETNSALRICINQSNQIFSLLSKKLDTIPNKKAGPALLQNRSNPIPAPLESLPE